jgi:hypothetical protein
MDPDDRLHWKPKGVELNDDEMMIHDLDFGIFEVFILAWRYQ